MRNRFLPVLNGTYNILIVDRKYLIVDRKYLIVDRKYLIVNRKYLIVRYAKTSNHAACRGPKRF